MSKTKRFYGCIRMPSPSNYEDICNRLKRKEKIDTFPRRGFQRINIFDKRSRRDLIQRCFNMTNGYYGWCGTCIEGATRERKKLFQGYVLDFFPLNFDSCCKEGK